MIQQHCQVKLVQCPNHFEICLIRLYDCHVNVGFRLDVRHGVAHLFEKNSADRDKVSNLDGKLCQKTVAISSVRPLEKFIELSANFLLIYCAFSVARYNAVVTLSRSAKIIPSTVNVFVVGNFSFPSKKAGPPKWWDCLLFTDCELYGGKCC